MDLELNQSTCYLDSTRQSKMLKYTLGNLHAKKFMNGAIGNYRNGNLSSDDFTKVSRMKGLNQSSGIGDEDYDREVEDKRNGGGNGNVPEPACVKITQHTVLCNRPKNVAGFYRRSLPDHLIDFSSTEGKRLFSEALQSGHMENYFKLVGQYFSQSDVAFCGLAVLCTVLNSLSIDPARIWKSPWRWFSEEMMSCCLPIEQIRKKGINFDEFKLLASCKGAMVTSFRFEECTLDQFREHIKRVTMSSNEFMVVSYYRKHVGQTGTGHFAPVAGYHEGSDKVLLLDVARFKYPPHWVPVPLLHGAMKDIDPDTNKSRGYFLLKSFEL
jgi:glutathione gamma-glutamylcysteinyltransferase